MTAIRNLGPKTVNHAGRAQPMGQGGETLAAPDDIRGPGGKVGGPCVAALRVRQAGAAQARPQASRPNAFLA